MVALGVAIEASKDGAVRVLSEGDNGSASYSFSDGMREAATLLLLVPAEPVRKVAQAGRSSPKPAARAMRMRQLQRRSSQQTMTQQTTADQSPPHNQQPLQPPPPPHHYNQTHKTPHPPHPTS